ncbi:putative mitochondrial protein transport protein Sec61 gamma subunit [Leptomonas pyrrhocoris]|uniref:Putative mitochondrial protein transport protein Sec61 gamma subunit n=1 Tax=Leptomonas pyrrhocoris TaxID=157538 RepID=A0A0M9G059_LEPPY|nr:putative mitochondrial protein transport protein Sec61 gamma subunit [Leptomonas pyrrhocoris]KPA79543.1 putative mitochondrial protein transport protein Sec61 gamma subunit [Leptomonas pyrrhocoris]|eukprot:XP_015657982.1 putative mitochondrial protein transport protein Sec61 gamma subunit [Leptomonas pyrrhocoris]
MDFLDDVIFHPIAAFAKNSRMLVRKCQKPNYNEFTTSAIAALIGFLIMGFLGFFVKLVFIPINNVILGA